MERTFEENRAVPGHHNYAVSESGHVTRIGREKPLAPQTMKRGGYLAVALWRRNRGRLMTIHQLVALAFLGPRPSPRHEVAHNDGNKRNNHWTNLRWATRAENEADKVKHGTSNRGQRNGQAKLTDEQTREVIRLASVGLTQHWIADRFGVSASCVSLIVKGVRRGR